MGKLDLKHHVSHGLWNPAKPETAIREEGGREDERERKGREENMLHGK